MDDGCMVLSVFITTSIIIIILVLLLFFSSGHLVLLLLSDPLSLSLSLCTLGFFADGSPRVAI